MADLFRAGRVWSTAKLLTAIALLLAIAGCGNNSTLSGATQDGSGLKPVKLFGQSDTPSKLGPGVAVGSAKVALDQEDIKKAIYRFRLEANIKSGTQRILGADLNGDGVGEGLVYFVGDEWCISTGCTLVVFAKGVNGFRTMSRIKRVKLPIELARTSSHGWRDIIVRTGNEGIGQRPVALKFNGNYPQNATTVREKLAELPANSELLFADDGAPVAKVN